MQLKSQETFVVDHQNKIRLLHQNFLADLLSISVNFKIIVVVVIVVGEMEGWKVSVVRVSAVIDEMVGMRKQHHKVWEIFRF